VRHRAPHEHTNESGETIRTMEHRAGWDATFSAPKSVSLTALVGGDERVRLAHRESVNIALDELEKYVQARIGGNHPAQTTGKWVAAKFEHDSSRPVDGYAAPQLHTHVVFFNMTELENGDARALQPRELYRAQQYGTAVYRTELALRLRELGYQIEASPHGAPEIKGYSGEYIEASSPRRQQIKEHLAEEGLSGAAAAQIAAHRTRGAKLNISHKEMQQKHQVMAEQFGNQPPRIIEAARVRGNHIEPTSQDEVRRAAKEAVRYARERSLEREAVADERDLMRDVLKRSMGEAPLRDLRREFEQYVRSGGLIEVEHQPGTAGRAFTTDEMIRLEQDNIRLMRVGQNKHPALATFLTRREIEQEYAHLSNSQRAVVDDILTSRNQITALEGTAGAGKTTALAAIRDAAEREGYQVEGFAPTSRAAQKLEEAGIPSNTLQHYLARQSQQEEAKRLYVLDESSLAGTRQMNEFLHRLNRSDRVLLVGDVRQHEAVEAGKPYSQLQEAGMPVARLDEVVRQKDPALKTAVEQLARREVGLAISNLDSQGRVHEIPIREERLRAIATEYGRQPHGTLVVSPDNESRRDLNFLIHREMQDRGQVKEQEHTIRVLDARQELTGADRAWAAQYQPEDVLRYSKGSKVLGIEAGEYSTVQKVNREENLITVARYDEATLTYDPRRLQGVAVYRESERAFAEGDRVQFTAPSKDLHVANRELGTITSVEENGDIAIHTDSGRALRFNTEEHPHLDFGYAVTSHSSQGQTADCVLIHADTEKSEQFVNARFAYVAVSRGRYDAQIYTNNKSELAQSLGRDTSRSTALDAHQQHEREDGHRIRPSSAGHDTSQDRGAAEHSHDQSSGESHGQTTEDKGQGQGQAAGE
jgi:conjugative relaxase-like TrwC/TraI family protein